MDVKVFRMFLKGIVAGTVTATALWGQGRTEPSGRAGQPPVVYSGCYPLGYWCGRRTQTDEFLLNVPTPLSKDECIKLCDAELSRKYGVVVDPEGTGTLASGYGYVVGSITDCGTSPADSSQIRLRCGFTLSKVCEPAGRRPMGLIDAETSEPVTTPGQYFAQMAYLEESAVTAFQYLVQELESFGAPETLIAVAREGIQEEVDHADMMKALCLRYGGACIPVVVDPFQPRTLFEFALDNVVEGCVRETYGALAAMYQSEHAEDPAVREVTRRIVFEESRHAMMSWEIVQWLETQLSPKQQEQCRQAMKEAVYSLEMAIAQKASQPWEHRIGVPPKNEALRMFDVLKQTVWA